MEDHRLARAILTEDKVPKSVKTGNAQGSYVFIMYQGHQQTLDFIYDPQQDALTNQLTLYREVFFKYIEPVREIEEVETCLNIDLLIE